VPGEGARFADDPSALLKIVRRVFDDQGHPLSVDFLTDRADKYRFHYSFPSFAQDIPEKLRDK
jgi:DNA-binding GntR family transcriptional regulator